MPLLWAPERTSNRHNQSMSESLIRIGGMITAPKYSSNSTEEQCTLNSVMQMYMRYPRRWYSQFFGAANFCVEGIKTPVFISYYNIILYNIINHIITSICLLFLCLPVGGGEHGMLWHRAGGIENGHTHQTWQHSNLTEHSKLKLSRSVGSAGQWDQQYL